MDPEFSIDPVILINVNSHRVDAHVDNYVVKNVVQNLYGPDTADISLNHEHVAKSKYEDHNINKDLRKTLFHEDTECVQCTLNRCDNSKCHLVSDLSNFDVLQLNEHVLVNKCHVKKLEAISQVFQLGTLRPHCLCHARPPNDNLGFQQTGSRTSAAVPNIATVPDRACMSYFDAVEEVIKLGKPNCDGGSHTNSFGP